MKAWTPLAFLLLAMPAVSQSDPNKLSGTWMAQEGLGEWTLVLRQEGEMVDGAFAWRPLDGTEGAMAGGTALITGSIVGDVGDRALPLISVQPLRLFLRSFLSSPRSALDGQVVRACTWFAEVDYDGAVEWLEGETDQYPELRITRTLVDCVDDVDDVKNEARVTFRRVWPPAPVTPHRRPPVVIPLPQKWMG